jgi:hypothetical protein
MFLYHIIHTPHTWDIICRQMSWGHFACKICAVDTLSQHENCEEKHCGRSLTRIGLLLTPSPGMSITFFSWPSFSSQFLRWLKVSSMLLGLPCCGEKAKGLSIGWVSLWRLRTGHVTVFISILDVSKPDRKWYHINLVVYLKNSNNWTWRIDVGIAYIGKAAHFWWISVRAQRWKVIEFAAHLQMRQF